MAAIHGFTMGSAWVNHLETETGSVEVGKAADQGRALAPHPERSLPGTTAGR